MLLHGWVFQDLCVNIKVSSTMVFECGGWVQKVTGGFVKVPVTLIFLSDQYMRTYNTDQYIELYIFFNAD